LAIGHLAAAPVPVELLQQDVFRRMHVQHWLPEVSESVSALRGVSRTSPITDGSTVAIFRLIDRAVGRIVERLGRR
jgi:hypothetical protein